MSFEKDALVEGGELDGLHNETTFREVRQYRSGHHLVRFYFLTRVYSTYLESVLSDFQSGPQPDVLIANSCIWDVNRYNDKHLEAYKTNLDLLFQRLKEVLSSQCLIIWNMTMPVGYKGSEIPEYTAHNLQTDVMKGNFLSTTLADFHKLDVLDMHYHFRCNLRLRCPDAIHWNWMAHRKYTQILLAHIAQAWGVEALKDKMPEGSNFHTAPPGLVAPHLKLHPIIQQRVRCSLEAAYIPGYTSFDESGINDMPDFLSLGFYTDGKLINSNAASPFVTDSPLLTTNITPGYFPPPQGPMFTRLGAGRKMKRMSWRGSRIQPYR